MGQESDGATEAILLDHFPHGRSEDGRPRYDQAPLGQALGVDDFRLYELILTDDSSVGIGDRIAVRPPADEIEEFRELLLDDLSSAAAAELEYAVEEIVETDEDRFLSVYNEAQPITLRLHQLDLLPGIGDTLRDEIIDTRKRQPFSSFKDVADRISGLHNPQQVIIDRILEELRDDSMKYYLFVGGPY